MKQKRKRLKNFILPFRLIKKTLMKKEFLFLGVIYVISMILLACQGKNTNGTQNSDVKGDKAKQVMKEVITDDNPNALFSKTVINYDLNGKITEELHFNNENILSDRYHYTYNKYGDKVEWKIFNGESDLSQKTEYIYDSSRKLVREICGIYPDYKASPDIRNSYYTYDSQGKLTRVDFENCFTTRHEFEYDKNNKLVKKVYYNSDNTIDLEFFDENGNKKGDKNDSYKYDEKNNIIEEIHDHSSYFSKFTFVYKYNEFGNWIERHTYYSDKRRNPVKLRGTEIKNISYYP